jgi:hypothetical protein
MHHFQLNRRVRVPSSTWKQSCAAVVKWERDQVHLQAAVRRTMTTLTMRMIKGDFAPRDSGRAVGRPARQGTPHLPGRSLVPSAAARDDERRLVNHEEQRRPSAALTRAAAEPA